MRICFNMSHVFNGHSTDLENAYALRSLLDCLINVNIAFLKFASNPVPRLYQSGVRYGRTEIWEPIPALYKRGYGDCKSLAAALIAEYTVRKIQATPVFRFEPKMREYHILVLVPRRNGIDRTQFEDPSRKLGMGVNEIARYSTSLRAM